MPPGDTLIYNSLGDLPDSIRQLTDSLLGIRSYPSIPDEKRPQYLLPEWMMFLLVLLVVGLSAFFYIVKPALAKRRKIRSLLKDTAETIPVKLQYDHWLCQYNPYYRSLPEDLRKRFLRRVILFRGSKEFRFHFLPPDEQIPLLLSAAAVQLTFGLRYYLLENYLVINIVKEEYKDQEWSLHGHVTMHSISVAWNKFFEGYANYADAANIGLHEMAHAASFDALYGKNENFVNSSYGSLEKYIREATPVLRDLRQGKNTLLDRYGAINKEEFWAVSIETFFEIPEKFRAQMPGLYGAICELLNQDPLLPRKILDKSIAGLPS